ncbi:MAG: recombinase family protein [Candidatus Eremiobacteraeota bacterium]|nr:recombinase family protein [Candidatus Eremiobacteraeota bacterium]
MGEVWAYSRVSTLKTEQELSLDEQAKRAERFAQDMGFAVRHFVERKSAKSLLHRPVLTKLLEELESLKPRQRPKYLYATAVDRIGRDMADCVFIGHQCRRLNIGLWIGQAEFKLNTFNDRLQFFGQSIGGDAENEARSRRCRDSWNRRRREGKPTSNKVPYGLQLVGERDVPISDSAQWVLNAFQWYAEGIGTHTIGKRMAGQAPPHTWLTTKIGDDGNRIEKTRAGTHWEALRVAKLLRQRRYRGTIVPSDLFDAIQVRLANTPKNGSRTTRQYPLSNAMSCKSCGRHLHGRATGHSSRGRLADGTVRIYSRKPLRYYACVVCHYMQNAQRLESEFFAEVANLSADEALLERWIATPSLGSADLNALRKEVKRLEAETDERVVKAKRDRLVDALMSSSSMGNTEFERQLSRIEDDWHQKREQLLTAKRRLEGDASSIRSVQRARDLLRGFDVLYESADYENKREMVSAVAEALGGLVVSASGLEWRKKPKLAYGLPTRKRRGRREG